MGRGPPPPMATRHWRHTHSFCGGSFPLPRRAGFIDFALWIYFSSTKHRNFDLFGKNFLTKTMRKSLIHQVYLLEYPNWRNLQQTDSIRFQGSLAVIEISFSVPIFSFKNPDVPRFYVQDPFLLYRVCISSEYPTDHPIANRCQ